MNDLDDLKSVKKIDSREVLSSLSALHLQSEQAWEESTQIEYPHAFQEANNIIICGMGGSSYGARIVKSLYDSADTSKIPISLSNNYDLPGYVNERTLVILSSYSGTTEETLSAAQQALTKKAMITGITTGGALAEFLKSNFCLYYKFNPNHNPSQQPRVGVGYMVMGLIGILAKLKYIPVEVEEVKKLIIFLDKKNSLYSMDRKLSTNPAKIIAQKLQMKVPIFIVSDFLEGAGYAVQNPFHETAKQFGVYFTIPELNHHLLEGLTYPEEIKKLLHFIFINSKLYHDKNQKRLTLTRDIIKKNSFSISDIKLSEESRLIQTMEFIQIGAFISFYLALIHGVDPAKIPYVDYFKKKLLGIS